MNALLKAAKSIPVQIAASMLILAGVWKLLGTVDVCGAVVFLVLMARSMKREKGQVKQHDTGTTTAV